MATLTRQEWLRSRERVHKVTDPQPHEEAVLEGGADGLQDMIRDQLRALEAERAARDERDDDFIDELLLEVGEHPLSPHEDDPWQALVHGFSTDEAPSAAGGGGGEPVDQVPTSTTESSSPPQAGRSVPGLIGTELTDTARRADNRQDAPAGGEPGGRFLMDQSPQGS